MKKIIRFFPILILFVLSICVVTFYDMQEREKYNNIEKYSAIGFEVPSDETMTDVKVDALFDLAMKHNVLLVKKVYNESTDAIDTYITTDHVVALYADAFEIDDSKANTKKVITTYETDHSDHYYKPDLLNNDRYTFYSSSYMDQNDVYKLGTYMLYYQNEQELDSFLKAAEELFHTPKEHLCDTSFGQLSVHTDLVFSGMLASIVFFGIFYFILVLFLFYKESKKIAVLTMLGFQKKDILFVMSRRNIKMLSIFVLAVSLLTYFIIPNAKIAILAALLVMNASMILLAILISYFALCSVYKYTSISNILKKQSIAKRISNICMLTKGFMIACLMLFTMYMIPLMQEYMYSINLLADSEKLMDYAVFPRLSVENAEYDDSKKYMQFYQEVVKQEIDHIYVRFDEYLETDKQLIEDYETMEKEGTAYRYASVDINYLQEYDQVYYDGNGKPMDIKSIDQEFFLLPTSKKAYADSFTKRMISKYKNYQIDDPVLVCFYDDRTFDTFDSQTGITSVDSPIFRVVHASNPYSYHEKSYGIDSAGTGMNTGLKFRLNGESTKECYAKLQACIKAAGLENVLVEDNLISYKEYYADEIIKAKKANSIFYSVIGIGTCIYAVLMLQTFLLFIEARKNEILVKSILGFMKKDLFKNIILWNVLVTLLPLVAISIYALLSASLSFITIVSILLAFMLFDGFLLMLVINIVKTDNVYTQIKGE